jgi:hypothetical protein
MMSPVRRVALIAGALLVLSVPADATWIQPGAGGNGGFTSTRITGVVLATLAGANTYTNTTTGCTVGDTLGVSGGTYTVQAVFHINSVDGTGRITGIVLNTGGSYSAYPTSPLSTSFISSTCAGAVTLTATAWNSLPVTIGTAPVNGWKVNSPTATDLWVTDDGTTPSVNGATSFRVFGNGGQYATETYEKPSGNNLQITSSLSGTPYIVSVW